MPDAVLNRSPKVKYLTHHLGNQEFEEMVGRTLFERNFSDTEPFLKFSETIKRDDLNERFVHAALHKILSEEIVETNWWIEKFVCLMQSEPLQSSCHSLKQIVAKGTRFDLLFKLLEPLNFSAENSQVLSEILMAVR